jgi:hypothetical protein
MLPQSAVGGFSPSPRKDSAEMEDETEPQAEFGDEWRHRIGQDFPPDQLQGSLATQAGRLDEIHDDNVHGNRTGQPVNPRGIHGGDHQDQGQNRCPEDGEQEKREDQRRNGHQRVNEA